MVKIAKTAALCVCVCVYIYIYIYIYIYNWEDVCVSAYLLLLSGVPTAVFIIHPSRSTFFHWRLNPNKIIPHKMPQNTAKLSSIFLLHTFALCFFLFSAFSELCILFADEGGRNRKKCRKTKKEKPKSSRLLFSFSFYTSSQQCSQEGAVQGGQPTPYRPLDSLSHTLTHTHTHTHTRLS